jgi:hypothetical protein
VNTFRDKLRTIVTYSHSYHEDENRYPRDFWHVKAWAGGVCTDWIRYGEQEEYTQLPGEVAAAEEAAFDTLCVDLQAVVDLFEEN